ncbi:MAG: phage/plasmid primase, P4 family [Limisphaerales bacterium]
MNTTELTQPNAMAENAMIPVPSARTATANEAAGLVYPKIGQHFNAFWEKEAEMTEAPSIEILDLVEEFWALTVGPLGTAEHPTVFVASENQLRRYNKAKGIYEPITESTVTSVILGNLELVAEFLPGRVQLASFLNLKNRQRLKAVVDRARDLLAVEDDFFQDRKHLHLAFLNGTLQIDNGKFNASEPGRLVRETLPLKYDPEAKCDLFLGTFLAHILEPADVDLLQRYLSQVLEGINHSQTILVLTGDAGWGKSSLMKILGEMVGWKNVGIIREQLFRDEFELAHYHHKNFLFHPDMPTDFLDRKEASIFKQLVGGDPLWANVKGDDGRMVLQGHYPTILACNGKPKIHLDQDTDAWLRRLVVLSLKTPDHEQHFGKMAELILKNESSGILNWLLEGRTRLAKDKLQLVQTPEQKARAATLLLASDSPAAFVRACLVKKRDGELGVVDLYEHYQNWCRLNHVRPFSSRPFTSTAKEEIEIGLGLKLRHDLEGGNGKARRGWRGLALVERAVVEKVETASCESVG